MIPLPEGSTFMPIFLMETVKDSFMLLSRTLHNLMHKTMTTELRTFDKHLFKENCELIQENKYYQNM